MDIKHFILKAVGISAICLAITGCSSDNDTPMLEVEHNRDLQSADVLSTEEFLNTGVEDFSTWQTSEDGVASRATPTLITIYGCSSQVGGGNYKYLIPNEIANALDISKAIYVAENVTCYTEIKIEGLGISKFFSPASSPLCGIMPGGSNFARGYSNTTPDAEGKIKFSTILIHIKSDMSGRNYNMWYPCSPANIQWNYNLVQ